MNKNDTMTQLRRLVLYAVIAALYTATSLALAPISFGGVQFRISEAMTLLPVIMPEAIIGVTIGCALTNLIGAMLGLNILGFLDVIVGTLATLIAAVMTYRLRHIRFKNIPLVAAVPPVLVNAIFIGLELTFAFSSKFEWGMFWSMAVSVGIGQLFACFALGIPLVMQLEKLMLRRTRNVL